MTEQTPKQVWNARQGENESDKDYRQRLITYIRQLERELATAQAKIATLESDITRHVQIATEQANEIAKLEEKRRADVGKCKLAVQFVRNKYVKSDNIGFRVVMECEAAIRAAFPEVFP